mmetsp:Transcript_10858/g.22912  ORF Transcript_10858/g.22912 Transcript_10858/m.22912 type:complete len:217 (+) Transcript_10858:799-1449(+)
MLHKQLGRRRFNVHHQINCLMVAREHHRLDQGTRRHVRDRVRQHGRAQPSVIGEHLLLLLVVQFRMKHHPVLLCQRPMLRPRLCKHHPKHLVLKQLADPLRMLVVLPQLVRQHLADRVHDTPPERPHRRQPEHHNDPCTLPAGDTRLCKLIEVEHQRTETSYHGLNATPELQLVGFKDQVGFETAVENHRGEDDEGGKSDLEERRLGKHRLADDDT